jgi:clusterin-associated protein 1
MLRRLHYPHPITVNSFKSPNFELVSGILRWIVQRLDGTNPSYDKIESEDDRVQFLNAIASDVATMMNISLDRRNLYAADDRAVKELVKISSILDEALTLAEDEASTSSEEEIQPEEILAAAKRASLLVGEIAEISVRLSSVLNNAGKDGKQRNEALCFLKSASGMLGDSSRRDRHIDSRISLLIESTNAAVERLDKECKILISNQRGTEEKMRKKTIDLERTSKRLECLMNVRPAYMDEYEKLEDELQVEHEMYVVRLRNVDYLEGELSSFKQAAIRRRAKAERSMKRMQKKFREEELSILNGRDDFK